MRGFLGFLFGASPTGRAPFATKSAVLVVADLENLHYAARDLGGRLDIGGLTTALRQLGAGELHAVASASGPMRGYEKSLRTAGWSVHLQDIPPRDLVGSDWKANADFAIAAIAGFMGARRAPAMFLLTGDGGLGAAIAWAIAKLTPETKVTIISFKEALAYRLRPASDPNITATFVIKGGVEFVPEFGERHALPHQSRVRWGRA